MSPLIFSLLLIQQPNLLPKPPVTETLSQARKWSVWQKQEQSLFGEALSALAQRDFTKADKLNRQLLAMAPKSLYDDPPTLPTVLIRPSGSNLPLSEDKPLAGWKWRRESAWLSVWAGANQHAFSEFQVIMASSRNEAMLGVEGALFCLARLRRWQDCLSLSKQTSLGGEKLANVYRLALSSQWESLRLAALRVNESPKPAGRQVGTAPSLSGSIGGRRGQTTNLPAAERSQLPGSRPSIDGASWASVEAALILLDTKMSAWKSEKASSAKKSQAVFWVNILLRDAREAFPNHRQAAYSALEQLRQ